MQIIRKNFTLKLLSLALAIVGWAYVRYASNPIIGTRFDQQISVPITTVNLGSDEVAEYGEKQAVVTVIEKRSNAPVKPDQIKAVLDLAGKVPGIYNVPIDLVAPDVAVQSLTPASVTLTIERIESRPFPIAVRYRGSSGKTVLTAAPTVAPGTVMVSGPASAVSRVAGVRVDVPLSAKPGAFDAMVRPQVVDASGRPIANLAILPDLVRVQLKLVPSSGASGSP